MASSYKVDVIFFLNPYQIWVAVQKSEGGIFFEQIGVYGVLPMKPNLDMLDGSMKSRRSDEWMPGVVSLMKELLENVDVFFWPVHADRTSSTFKDKDIVHKYGELTLVNRKGKKYKLSKLLVKSTFAMYSENIFLELLESGNIKTKLSEKKTEEMKSILKQYKTMKELGLRPVKTVQTLTVEKLELHNKIIEEEGSDFFNYSNASDEEPVGRGIRSRDRSGKQKRYIKKITELEDCPKPLESCSDLTQTDVESTSKSLNAEISPKSLSSLLLKRKLIVKESQVKDILSSNGFNKDENKFQKLKHNSDNARKIPYKTISDEELNFEHDNKIKQVTSMNQETHIKVEKKEGPCLEIVKKPKKSKTAKKSTTIPEYNAITQTCVKYGPPDADISSLPPKIVSKEQFDQARNLKQIFEGPDKEVPVKRDGYQDEDSGQDISQPSQRQLNAKVDMKVIGARTSEVNGVKSFGIPEIKRFDFKEAKFGVETEKMQLKPEISKFIRIGINDKKSNNETAENKNTDEELCTKLHEGSSGIKKSIPSSLLRKKLQIHKENLMNQNGSSNSTVSDGADASFEDSSSASGGIKKITRDKELDSDDESVSEILENINAKYPKPVFKPEKNNPVTQDLKNHVNPFKNIDPHMSVFVDKLVSPILLVHSKMNKRFEPSFKIRDINFNSHIQIILKNMNVVQPMTLQTMSWFAILRGYSTFLISPKGSGKTMGYLPAICNLIADNDCVIPSTGPICIIVCATAISVSAVEKLAKLFLNKHKVLACYTGMNELDLTTSLLNGCDLLITTPSLLVRLLQTTEFGVDFSRLTTFVLDDCERLAEVYGMEIKFYLVKIKEMLRNRTVKELKVQYILASRVWSDFMEPLARKATDTVVCIGAFQECVLYSKASTTVSFLAKHKKIESVLEFVKQSDRTKRTVIVCRSDEEVEQLEKALTIAKYTVFACNTTMTVHDLYNLSISWNEYKEPISSPVMVCCDDNLSHMNITDAHYLVHFSLPDLFSKFCKRFSVLNDNYGSIFKEGNESVKIKVLLEEDNTEQLPKILHFITRCTNDVPESLEKICASIVSKKELAKADRMVPVCDNLLALGECPDFWNCQERHILSKEHDKPKDWIPVNGVITFRIIHYHNAVSYSARLLTHVKGADITKYPQNYNMLSMKISMYFSKESNRKLHGIPEVGDICAVCVRQNFFLRCQVVKILTHYQNGKPNYVLVKEIDEGILERTRDIYLYHLPDEMKAPETYVVQVRLANIQPKDKDITFSALAMEQLQMITETDLDLNVRGHIVLTIGNCILVDRLETFKTLSVTDQIIIRHDFRQELAAHAIDNPEHIMKLEKICKDSDFEIVHAEEIIEVLKPVKKVVKPQWAHLEKDDLSLVYFASALDPATFFVRLVKFEDSCNRLIREIEKYTELNREPIKDVTVGDIVLAKFPGASYERARIDDVMKNRVKCFFVDQGDWMEIPLQDVAPIPDKFITQLPFQAIECRLYGVKPVREEWTEFSTTWLSNHFEDDSGDLKQLYVQYYVKEKALHTEGNKYAVVIMDTTLDQELNINKMLVDVNLADPNDDEWGRIDELVSKKNIHPELTESQDQNDISDGETSWENVRTNSTTPEIVSQCKIPCNDLFPKKPLRSVPLNYDTDSSEEKWQINNVKDFIGMLKSPGQNLDNTPNGNLLAIENTSQCSFSKLEKAELDSGTNLDNDDSSDTSSSILEKIRKSKIVSGADDLSDVSTSAGKISNTFQIVSSVAKILDSDDFITPDITDGSVISGTEKQELSAKEQTKINDLQLRRPKLCWRQNNEFVVVKILLIGVEKYNIEIQERCIKFGAVSHDTQYGFDLELYGVIDTKKSSHENKGQYILVKLGKVLNRNWLTLARNGIQKWIVYDVDSIDTSSDEEESVEMITQDIIRNFCKPNSESEDEDFIDDANFTYTR